MTTPRSLARLRQSHTTYEFGAERYPLISERPKTFKRREAGGSPRALPLPVELATFPDGSGSGNTPATPETVVSSGSQTANTPKATYTQLLFDQSTDEHVMWSFRYPEHFSQGGIKLRFHWTAKATSGAVVWKAAAIVGVEDTTDLDAAVFGSVRSSGQITVPNVQGEFLETEINLDVGLGCSPGDHIVVFLGRDADTGTDTLAADACLLYAEVDDTNPAPSTTATAALLTAGSDSSNLSVYTTASITPSADKLVVAAVVHEDSSVAAAPTLTGCGLTWVLIDTIAEGGGAVRLSLYRAMGASPTSGAVTIDLGGNTEQNCGWIIAEFGSVDTGGTNGSAAVAQFAQASGVVGGNLAAALGAFAAGNDAVYAVVSAGAAVAADITEEAGYTRLSETGDGGLRFMVAEFLAAEDQTPSFDLYTGGSAVNWTLIAIEIKVA